MSPENLIQNAIAPVIRLLPAKMDSRGAIAMLVAIALQESRIEHRRQVGGPARGYWQFEQGGGVHGVLTHPASKPHIQVVLAALDYSSIVVDIDDSNSTYAANACYIAIEHNDILAAAFARLLLWTLPQPLPAQNAPQVGWAQYLQAWRPGKPHVDTWANNFAQGWELARLA